ncbi:MAG: fibronectin type III domain-containing protein [Desulfuromonadaceae bacterium]
MRTIVKRSLAAITVFSLMTLGLMLAGCGGGSGGVSSKVVSGTAAVGSTLSGQVTLKDSASPTQHKSTVIASDGTFAIDVTDMKAPFVLQAVGSADGVNYKLHSFSDGPGTANINPLTHVIVASASESTDDDYFERVNAEINHRTSNNLTMTVSILLAKLEPLLKQYNAEQTNPITSHYIANHLGLDGMFDNVKITVSDETISVINRGNHAVIFSGPISDIANGVFDSGALPSTVSAPATPNGLTAVGGTGQVTLSWTSVSNATSYNVYYAATSGVTATNGTKLTSVSTPYIQTGLTAGTTYFYVVTAVNSSGESAASAIASTTTASAPPEPTVPAAPTSVTAAGGTNQVAISWGTVSSATSYNLYYSTTSGVTKTNGTRITSATSPTVQTGLAAGTAYYYIITAVNSTGEGAASNQVAATTLATVPTPTVPARPSAVSAVGGANQATITWPAVAGADSYNVYWSSTTGITTTNGMKVAGVSSPYVKTGLSAGTTYFFIVTASNSVGESTASIQTTGTTNAAPPAVPATPTGVITTGGANQATISWSAVSGATSYNIYFATTSGVTKTNGGKITNATSPYTQTGLAAGTTYYYIVTAVNSAGEGTASAQVSAATNAPPVQTCGTCHAIPPSTGQHSFHVGSMGYNCSSCHGAGYSSTAVTATTHMNGGTNLATTIGWNATSRSCSNSCHGNKSW